jgi:hypothetical protein
VPKVLRTSRTRSACRFVKRTGPIIAAALLTVSCIPAIRADIYTVRRQGANIVPEKSEDISMDDEVVRIEPHDYGYSVSATFVMRNHAGRPVHALVAFPILGSSYEGRRDLGGEFQVHVKSASEPDRAFHSPPLELRPGRPRTARDDHFAAEPPRIIGDYPEAVVWEVDWAPAETKIIRVQFDMGEPTILPGSNHLVAGWEWRYIVTTGSLWKGPIGRADISIKAGHPVVSSAALPPFRSVSYPEQAHWHDDHLVSWHFDHWTPTDEIWLRTVEWRGLTENQVPDYRFFLPEYRAAEQAYDEATIEKLVERDLTLATKYLPAEARGFDRNLLRIAIADWLLHEIYARHGDSFDLGENTQLPSPRISHLEMDDRLYSAWYDLFRGYSYRDGWYQPNFTPPGRVKTSSLHPMEQNNAAFLRTYLEQLRSQPAYRPLQASAHHPGAEQR